MVRSPQRSPQRMDEYISRRIEAHEQKIQRLEEEIKRLDEMDASVHRTASAAGAERCASPGFSAKRVDADELQSIVDRLARPLDRSGHGDSTHDRGQREPRILAAEEVEELVDRLGVRDISTRNEKRDERLTAAEDSLPLKQIILARGEDALVRLEIDQQQALGERLCNQALEKRKDNLTKMRDAMFNSTMKSPEAISRSRARDCAIRLCDGSLSKKESEMCKLQEKYMGALSVSRKLSAAEQKSCAERLSKK